VRRKRRTRRRSSIAYWSYDHGWQTVLQFFVELENGFRDRRW